MTLELRLEVDGINAGQGGLDYLLPGWTVTGGGPGRIGSAKFPLQSIDGGDLALHNQSYLTLGLFDTSANRYTQHLWCGFAAVPDVSQIPGGQVKTWSVDAQDVNVLGKALVSDVGGAWHVRLPADTCANQINALCTAFTGGLTTHYIDGSTHVLDLTPGAILPPIDGAGLTFETILGTIFTNAQRVNPALVPLWVITPDPQPGTIGGGFSNPVLWVWDDATTVPAIVASYSTTPDLTHYPILPATPYSRRLESPEMVNRRQAITATGQVYTAQDAVSLTRHPNPFAPTGAWGAAAVHDTANTGTTANATATATVSGGAVTGVTMNLNGTGYLQTPSVVFTDGGGTGAAGLANMGGYLLSVLLTAGGSGYTGPPRVVFTGGGGSGAQAQAILIGGAVGSVTITHPGSGYTSPPAVSFVSGSGAAATAGVSGGHVTGVLVGAGGTNYTSPPAVSFSGGGGTGAAAHANIGGAVLQVAVNVGGSGYTGAPTAVFSGGGGTGAAATVTTNGNQVTGLTLTSGGSGYTAPPTVTIVGGGGSGAVVTATIGGAVITVTLDAAGTGYSSAPTVAFTSGTGAAATAQIGGQVTSVTLTAGGSGYTTAPTVTFADAVQQALDAQIRPVSQPLETDKILVDVPAAPGMWVAVTLDVIAGFVDVPLSVVGLTPDYSIYGADHPCYLLELGSLRLRPGEAASGGGAPPVEGVRLNPPENFAETSVFVPALGNTRVTYTWIPPVPPPGRRIDHYLLTVTINTGAYHHTVPGTATSFVDYVNPGEHIDPAFLVAYDQDGIPSFPSNPLTFTAADVSTPDPPTALRVVGKGVYPSTGQGWAIIGWTPPAVLPDHYDLQCFIKGALAQEMFIAGNVTQSPRLLGLTPMTPITIQLRSETDPGYYGAWAVPPLVFAIPWFAPPRPPPDQPGIDSVVAEWSADDESVLALAGDVTYRSAASAALSPAPGDAVTLSTDAYQGVTPGAWLEYGIAAVLLDGDTDTAAELDFVWGDGAGTSLLTSVIPLTPLPAGATLTDGTAALTDESGALLTTLPDLGVWEGQIQVPSIPPGIKTLLTAVLVTASLTAAGTVYADVFTPPRPALTAPALTPGAMGTRLLTDHLPTSASSPFILQDLSDGTDQVALYASGAYNLVIQSLTARDRIRIGTSSTALEIGADGLTFGGAEQHATRSVGTSDTLTAADHTIRADATSGNLTLTLPAISTSNAGRPYAVVKIDATANKVTLAADAADTIVGAATYDLLTRYASVLIEADNSHTWYIYGSH